LVGGTIGLVVSGVAVGFSSGPPDMSIELLIVSVACAGVGWLTGTVVGWSRGRGARAACGPEAWCLRVGAVAFLLLGFIAVKDVTTSSFGPQIDDLGLHDPRRLLLATVVRVDTALAIATLLTLSIRPRTRSGVVHRPS
jgi:hypothetical protein